MCLRCDCRFSKSNSFFPENSANSCVLLLSSTVRLMSILLNCKDLRFFVNIEPHKVSWTSTSKCKCQNAIFSSSSILSSLFVRIFVTVTTTLDISYNFKIKKNNPNITSCSIGKLGSDGIGWGGGVIVHFRFRYAGYFWPWDAYNVTFKWFGRFWFQEM